jgi:hypothetical protein
VGHKFGGILIKSSIIEVNKVARRKICEDVAEREAKDSCEAFQHNLSGIMLYSMPHFMTRKDIQIMLGENNINRMPRPRTDPGTDPEPIDHRTPSAWQALSRQIEAINTPSVWQALSRQIEAINEDFEDSIAHDHTKICMISHGLKVNSLTFMLPHVLDDGHINILAFVEGHPYGKS